MMLFPNLNYTFKQSPFLEAAVDSFQADFQKRARPSDIEDDVALRKKFVNPVVLVVVIRPENRFSQLI
ncbi:hypothetical protein PT974_01049 [Cladobotryum mycophilum]|uniref:Uncharacterized protein n=1 Tax=Cladobotryum mycophilum TaxID=491253 RepID=A0ABR0T2M0_9HYPO